MPWKRPSKRKNDNNENDKTATKITKADPEVLKKIAEEILPTEKPDNTKNESQKQESQTSVNQEIGYYGESSAKGSLLGDAPVQEHETIQKQKIEKETANNDVNQEQNQNQISESQWNNFEPVVEETDDSEKWRVKREKERDGFIPDDVKIYLTDSNFKLPPQIWNLEIWCYQPINLLFQVASKSFLPMPEYQYWEPTVNHYQNSNNNNNSWNNSGYNNSYQQNNQSNSNYCSGSLAFNGTICQLENVQMDKKKFKNVVTCFMLQHCFPDSFFLPKDVFTYRHQLQLGNDANWPNKVQDYHGKRIEQITKQNETKGHKVISSIISQQSEKWCKIIDSEQFRYCLYKSTGTDGSIKDYLGTDQDIEVGNQEQMREIRRNNLTTLSSKTKGLLSPPGSSSAQNNINNFNTNGNGLLSNPATYTLSEDPQNVNDLDWEALSQNENLFGINNKPIKLVALNDLKLLMCWYFDWQTMNDIEESADQTKSKKIQAFYTEKENRAKKIQELRILGLSILLKFLFVCLFIVSTILV